MSFLAGLFLGGVNRGIVDDIGRATRAGVGTVTDAPLVAENRRLLDLALRWRAYAGQLEAEVERLRAVVASTGHSRRQ